ncbi:MAG TPA: substrate-binding domain-containing protein, partial [Stellaceae bacterium]|nr:substrate-binding domain-containing protein [Stellaceae bacterium]
IAGLGDLEIARELSPSLTTVRIPAYEIGRRAGEVVVTRLAGDAAGERIVDLGFSIERRESTRRSEAS